VFNDISDQRDAAIIEDISHRLPPPVKKFAYDNEQQRRLVGFNNGFMAAALVDKNEIEKLLVAHDNGDVVILPSGTAYDICISKKLPRKELTTILERVRLDYLRSPLHEQYRSAKQMTIQAADAALRSLRLPTESGSSK
jgi:hypothetical protein